MTQIIHTLESDTSASRIERTETFALDILAGLSARQKSIPAIYHYDAVGSRLFKKITELPEYYLTGCEIDTLRRNSGKIAEYFKNGSLNLIEFGSGDGSKTQFIIDRLLEIGTKFKYIPIDISESALEDLASDFGYRFPDVIVNGLVADYFSGLKWLNNRDDNRNMVLFLGSNIGNFAHSEARMFLRNLWINLSDGDLVLIGFDLKKDIDLMLKAYNDSEGITARFNLNLLSRINRELGGEFDISQFRFFSTYEVFSGAIESYLVSLKEQEVPVNDIGRSFYFRSWDAIHTEYSYKYHISDIEGLAAETGYRVKEHLFDSLRYFVDSIWEVKKDE